MKAIVTVESLRARGYQVTTLKEQSAVLLAENDAKEAYFKINETFEGEKEVAMLHAIVFSLLLTRRIQSTRYGSVVKVSQYSINAEREQIKQEVRTYCKAKIEAYEREHNFESVDILGIYDKLFYV